MISLVYNLDTRKKFLDDKTVLDDNGGCCSVDFMLEGLREKLEFLKPYELEVIVYIDKHENIPHSVLARLEEMQFFDEIKHLIIKDHNAERYGKAYGKNNNDLIYAECLSLATGDYVIHFDADTLAYRADDCDVIGNHIKLLDKYKYISLPTPDSPYCVDKDNPIMKGLNYQWASTRYFICRREMLPSKNELIKCFDNKYLKQHYGQAARPNCVEHILGVIAGEGNVYYPKIELNKYIISSWGMYYKGTIEKLHKMNYKDVINYIKSCNPSEFKFDLISKKIGEE
jgi:hypothetical protein